MKHKTLSRAQRQLAETDGMSVPELESYILAMDDTGDEVTAELAARYLPGNMYAQGVRILMREGSLPIGYVSGSRCHICPRRLVRWKRGEMGVNEQDLTTALAKAFERVPAMLADALREAVAHAM